MNLAPDNLFYTKEHDWIRFTGAIAQIGIARFKLTGIPKIDNIGLFGFKTGDVIQQGALILNIHYKEYVIAVYAPTTCTFLRMNPIIENGSWDLIAGDLEGAGYLFTVEPQLQDNGLLLLPSFYKNRLPIYV